MHSAKFVTAVAIHFHSHGAGPHALKRFSGEDLLGYSDSIGECDCRYIFRCLRIYVLSDPHRILHSMPLQMRTANTVFIYGSHSSHSVPLISIDFIMFLNF